MLRIEVVNKKEGNEMNMFFGAKSELLPQV
jgi:hypothetical protein